mgnify:CR=1 FL=1|jgi:hypothetical protein
MSIFNDKALKGVSEAVAKIMDEELKGNQHKIDANHNGKIDGQDFKILRGKKTVKESAEKAKMDYDKDGKVESPKAEVLGSRIRAAKLAGKLKEEVELNEETEQLDEYESKGGKYTHKGTYGREKGAKYGESDYSKGGEEEKETEKAVKSPKRASKGYGARQNMGMRGQSTGEKKKKVNESLSFTEMLELYNEHGLKVLAPIETEEMDIDGTTVEVIDADKVNGVVETMVEEPDNETFTKEVEAQKAKNAGGGKKAEVAKASVQAVEVQKEEVEQIDEISKELAGKYLTAPQGKGANKYKTGEGESTYPNWSALSKHQKNVKRALQRSGSSSLNKKPSYYKEDVEQLDEKLPASASAGDYIHDFVHSDNPKFAGKSTKERQKMALGAFYAKNKGK